MLCVGHGVKINEKYDWGKQKKVFTKSIGIFKNKRGTRIEQQRYLSMKSISLLEKNLGENIAFEQQLMRIISQCTHLEHQKSGIKSVQLNKWHGGSG